MLRCVALGYLLTLYSFLFYILLGVGISLLSLRKRFFHGFSSLLHCSMFFCFCLGFISSRLVSSRCRLVWLTASVWLVMMYGISLFFFGGGGKHENLVGLVLYVCVGSVFVVGKEM